MKDRKNRADHVQHAMAKLHLQLDRHDGGEKVLDESRLKSIRMRIEKYEQEYEKWSQSLTDEVRACFSFVCLPTAHLFA